MREIAPLASGTGPVEQGIDDFAPLIGDRAARVRLNGHPQRDQGPVLIGDITRIRLARWSIHIRYPAKGVPSLAFLNRLLGRSFPSCNKNYSYSRPRAQ